MIRVLYAPPRPKTEYIRTMFDGFADRYDLFTALIGFGQARRLRNRVIRAAVKPGARVLDLGCGTGDLALESMPVAGPLGEVVGLDFSSAMLKAAAARSRRLKAPGQAPLRLVCRGAEELPFEEPLYDAVISAFVLRNLYERIDRILEGVRRSLKPGGRIAWLDLTEPPGTVRRALYRFYMFVIVGVYGLTLFGRKYPVPYLPQSASRFGGADDFLERLRQAGFVRPRAQSLMLGSVTLYTAETPA